MKKYFIILISLHCFSLFGQTIISSHQSDLSFIYDNIKRSASYKTQKAKQRSLDLKYNELSSLLRSQELSTIGYYIKLYELIDIIKDNHNWIRGNTKSFTYQDLQDKQTLSTLKTQPEYNIFPKPSIDLDSLEHQLSTRKKTDYEGIYHYEKALKIAVFKNNDGLYQGIILKTEIPSWERGETILYLQPKGNHHFRMFMGGLLDKQLFSMSNYFDNGTFRAFNWTKASDSHDYYYASYASQPFFFKNLDKDFSYLKLGTFSSSNHGIAESKEFHNTIIDSLNSPKLIVDLRNNGGGGDKSSKQFLKLLKKYKGDIYVLANYYTASNAEQFIVKLKLLKKNIVIVGDRTAGVITYGHNYGKFLETPSKLFKLQFTDMDDNWKTYIKYEIVGIEPDIYLENTSNWVAQVTSRYRTATVRQ
jgi:hypothetical protein